MYVCMYIRMYTYVCVCMYVYVCVCARARVRTRVNVYMTRYMTCAVWVTHHSRTLD